MTIPFDKTIFTFGYSIPYNSELILNYPDQTDRPFDYVASRLAKLSHLNIGKITHYYPFDLANADVRLKKVDQFRFSEWILVGGIRNITENNVFRVFLINRNDHDFSLVYDFGSQTVYTIATNGCCLLDENENLLEGEDIYELFENVESESPASKNDLSINIAAEEGSVPRSTQNNGRLYEFHSSGYESNRCKINRGENDFINLENEIQSISLLNIYEKAFFYPRNARTGSLVSSITSFHPKEWFILAANFYDIDSVFNVLLVRKDNPSVALVLSPLKRAVYTVMTNGYLLEIDGAKISQNEALDQSKRFVNGNFQETIPSQQDHITEEGEEENEKQPVDVSATVSEKAIESKKDETTTPQNQSIAFKEDGQDEEEMLQEEAVASLQPVRHVYVTRRFLRCVEDIKRKNQPGFIDKLNKIYQCLLTENTEELQKFFSLRHSKKFNNLDWCSLSKFRVANSGPFQADRIFYLRGDDCKNHFGRNLSSDAIVLLYLSDTPEHDKQGEIAQELKDKFKKEDDEVLTDLDTSGQEVSLRKEIYEVTFQRSAAKDKPSYSQYGILSTDQRDLLNKEKAPCAFSGSAGTGKTLMSIDLYRSLREEHSDYRLLYLTYQDALKGQVKRSLDELGVVSECLTFKDLVFQELGTEISYKEHSDFTRWIRDTYLKTPNSKGSLSRIASDINEAGDIAYVFYRGVIEGSSKNQHRKIAELLTKSEFLSETKDELGVSNKQKDDIYHIAEKYRDHVDRHKEITDNMAAEMLMKRPHPVYDAIIVDETQDLTELQILSICSLLKVDSRQLYFFGDDNQAINPTIFTIEDAAACVKMALGPSINVPVQVLRGAYRSSSFLIHYINDINKIKRKVIGANGSENDSDEISLRVDESGSMPRLITDPALVKALLTNPEAFKSDTVVIVQNDRIKEDIIARFPDISSNDIVTITEAKGREWDNAVLYELLSSESDLWETVLSEQRAGRKSTLHRMLFNRYYVALTRAKDRLIIIETNAHENLFNSFLKPLTLIQKEEDIPQYFNDTLSADDWFSYAVSSFNDRDYKNARRCLGKISNDNRAVALSNDIDLYELFAHGIVKENAEDAALYIECFLRYGDVDNLKKLYERQEADYKIRLLALDESSDLDSVNEATSFFAGNPTRFTDDERAFFQDRFYGLLHKKIKAAINGIGKALGGQNYDAG